MDRFYGFDLGDAESAVSRLDKNENDVPEILPVNEAKSFKTPTPWCQKRYKTKLKCLQNVCTFACVAVALCVWISLLTTPPTNCTSTKSTQSPVRLPTDCGNTNTRNSSLAPYSFEAQFNKVWMSKNFAQTSKATC